LLVITIILSDFYFYKYSLMRVNIFLMFFFIGFNITAQVKKISFSEFINAVQKSPDSIYRLSNTEIYSDKASIEYYSTSFGRSRFDKNISTTSKSLIISKAIILSNVSFAENMVFFKKIIFEKDFIINTTSTVNVSFTECEFKSKFIFNNYQLLELDKCIFGSDAILSQGQLRTEITKCVFGNKVKSESKYQVSFDGSSNEHAVIISGSTFYPGNEKTRLSFFLRFSEISLKYTNFQIPVSFSYIYVRDKFSIRNCNFGKNIIFATVKLPIENSDITWPDLSNKITISKDSISRNDLKDRIYEGKTDEELSQDDNYNELISTYSKFVQIFKFRNSSEWYNECYIEMKDIMTRRAAYVYHKNPNFKNFLDWKIKIFLKEFSDYGTDYTKSIIYALDVVLFFSLIFFFFPSEKDNLTRDNFYLFFVKSNEYFRTEKNLISNYKEKREKEIRRLKHFRIILIKSRKSSPKIFSYLAWPFYKFYLAINSIKLVLLNKANLLSGSSDVLSVQKKRRLAFGIIIFFIGYVLWGIFIRALNAFALSLNSLTTLGYGGFTAQGISRYLVVIEGLIGWFLLTIFSVSLISQVL